MLEWDLIKINKDLGFSDDDRKENIRRIAEVAKLLSDSGVIVITAFISPFREERENAKDIIGRDNFLEVFVKADLEVCEERDPKGLYKKARAGEIPMFTGIDSPYEEPVKPFQILNTSILSVDDCRDSLLQDLYDLGIIKRNIKEIDNLDKKKTISIDFDGVIHKYSKGFQGLDNAYDPPMDGAINALHELHEQGYILKILSSRPKEVIYPWLEKWHISHLIDEVSNHKFPATIYIDDRGYHFTDWDTTIKGIFEHPKLKK
jgi:adenylyl-sulfate kinase